MIKKLSISYQAHSVYLCQKYKIKTEHVCKVSITIHVVVTHIIIFFHNCYHFLSILVQKGKIVLKENPDDLKQQGIDAMANLMEIVKNGSGESQPVHMYMHVHSLYRAIWTWVILHFTVDTVNMVKAVYKYASNKSNAVPLLHQCTVQETVISVMYEVRWCNKIPFIQHSARRVDSIWVKADFPYFRMPLEMSYLSSKALCNISIEQFLLCYTLLLYSQIKEFDWRFRHSPC